jgi:LEA14-like dessication related protein
MWKYIALPVLIVLLSFCKSLPNQDEAQPKALKQGNPVATMEFDRIEVLSMKQAALHYRLKADNPRLMAADIEIRGWNGFLNGVSFDTYSAILKTDSGAALGTRFHVEPVSTLEKDLILLLDLYDSDKFLTELFIDIEYHYKNDDTLHETITETVTFPWIREPKFDITSIKILQADIVNTRAELNLVIKNPNVFPINLLSFRYELYGDGSFWARGVERDLLLIPAKSTSETIINFEMNFIGMNRRLLDDIIAMRQVRYRVVGEMEVGSDMPWLPRFSMKFDYSGDSAVLK